MKIRNLVVIGIFSFIYIGCTSNKNKTEVELYTDEVIALHDVAMAKMGDIRRARKALKKIETQNESIVTGIKNLNDVEEAMFDWMRRFHDKDHSNLTEDLQMADLKKYYNQMDLINKDTDGYIAAAKKIAGIE